MPGSTPNSADPHRSRFLYIFLLILPPFKPFLLFSSSYLPWRERRGLNNPHPQGWQACIAHRGRLPPFDDASCVPISAIFDILLVFIALITARGDARKTELTLCNGR